MAAAGALLTGCPVALLAAIGNSSFVNIPKLTLNGDVLTAGRSSIKIGALRYFEGTDATGSFAIQQGDTMDFYNKTAIFIPTATSDIPRGQFKLDITSSYRVAQFLVVAWEDINKNGKFDTDEVRAPETYLIMKMDGSWFGLRTSGAALVPLASESVVVFGDATKVKNYRFVMPELDEPPIAEPDPATPSA